VFREKIVARKEIAQRLVSSLEKLDAESQKKRESRGAAALGRHRKNCILSQAVLEYQVPRVPW
jgi:hypothetical protein